MGYRARRPANSNMKPIGERSAFPTTYGTKGHGITIRDWFASQERSEPTEEWLLNNYSIHSIAEDTRVHEILAKWRYEMADAMLAARQPV